MNRGYTFHEGWATVFATATMGCAFIGLVRDDLLLGQLALVFLAGAVVSFVAPWFMYLTPVLVPLVGAFHSLLAASGTRIKRAWREHAHRVRLVRILAVHRPGTRVALVAQPLDVAVGAVLLHRLTLHHIRPTTTHVGLYATAPWRRVVAVYEVASIEAVDDGYLVKLGQGGHLTQPLPLAVACGLTRAPTPVRYLPDINAHVLSGALTKGTT
jgi:hypothetical protein